MYISKMFTRDQGSSELQGPWTDRVTHFSYLSEPIGTSFRSGPDISCQTGGGRGQKGLVISEKGPRDIISQLLNQGIPLKCYTVKQKSF